MNLWRDLRSPLRTWRRQPGFLVLSVSILALGLAATGSLISIVDAVFFEALPYEEAGRLVVLRRTEPATTGQDLPISYPDFVDWRERHGVFTDLVAHTDPYPFNLSAGEEAQHITGEFVAGGYFELLGVAPILGRVFTRREDTPANTESLAVIAHALWQRRFGGDPSVVGTTLVLDEESYTILGVLPPGFRGLSDQAEVWLPLRTLGLLLGRQHLEVRDFFWIRAVVGRLRPGIGVERAQAAMSAVAAGIAAEHPDSHRGVGVRVLPLRQAWFAGLRASLLTLLGAAAVLLLISCANVANLLLARAVARRREMALRSALGARRRQLIRQLLAESVLLALLAAVPGLLLAHWSTGWLISLSGMDLRGFIDVRVDPRLIGAVTLVALACALGFGLAPALGATRIRLSWALHETTNAAKRGRGPGIPGVLVMAQVALATVLLAGAGQVVRGFHELRHRSLGFEASEVLTFRVDLRGPSFAQRAQQQLLMRQALDEFSRLPRVASVALASPAMPTDRWHSLDFTLEDRLDSPEDATVTAMRHQVSPGYFDLLGVPILEGRDFTAADDAGAPGVVILSRSAACRFWPGEEAVGKRLKIGSPSSRSAWYPVVGVVGDVEHDGLGDEKRHAPDLYLPLLKLPPAFPPILNFLLRPEGAPASALIPSLADELGRLAPRLPLYDVATLDERLERQTTTERFLVLLVNLFAGMALLLAAVGIFGVISYTVARRSQEIGIRMALGARRADVVRHVVSGAAALALAGGLAGIVGSVGVGRVLASRLRILGTAEVSVLVGAFLVLFAVAMLASYLPARRAARSDPAVVLRVR